MFAAHPTRPLRVLLVEDDESFAELLSLLLGTTERVQVVGHAWDGVEGVDLAWKLRPDVVVMDLRMPRMDGFEATRQIVEKIRGTRVLVVSSSHARDDVDRAREAGAAGYLPKDRASAELLDELERLRPVSFAYGPLTAAVCVS